MIPCDKNQLDGEEKQRIIERRIKMKKMISIVLCVVMLVTTMAVPALANSSLELEEILAAQGIEMLEFDPEIENVLDALQQVNPSVDLTDAVVTEEMDAFGNVYFVVETPMTEVESFNEVTLAELAYVFLNDPEADARLLGNTLTYTLPDGTRGMIVETIDRGGRRTLQITEGELSSEFVFDQVSRRLLVDGEAITVSLSVEFVVQQFGGVAPRSPWFFVLEERINIRTPQVVSQMLVGGVILAITSFILPPTWAFTTGVAQTIINGFRATRPNHDSIYATRRMLRDANWWFFRYEDSFYTWNARAASQRITRTIMEVPG